MDNVYQQVFENSFDSSWVVSLKESRLEYANAEATQKLLGFDLEPFWKNPDFWLSRVHPDDRPLALANNERCFATGTSTANYRMIHKSGRIIHVVARIKLIRDEAGNPWRLIGSTLDVTDISEATQRLKASEELFSSLATFAPIGIYKTDTFGKGTYLNKKWCEITGLEFEEALGDGWVKAIHPDDRDKVFEAWKESTSQKKNFSFQYRFLNPKSGIRFVSSRAAPILDTNGEIIGYVGTVEDITERIEAEKTLNLQRQKLVASSKMSSLGEMASGIAHEINNPLMIIVGACTRIRRMLDNNEMEAARKYLNKIESTGYRISKIIKGLRAFSRDAEQDLAEKVTLAKIVEDTLELCSQRFENDDISLVLELGDLGREEITVRPTQIVQVLLNLLVNAYDAVSEQNERWVRLRAHKEPQRLYLQVIDSGRGIPAVISEKMMEPFFTTKDVGKGTGLGLSISKGIMEENAGRLSYRLQDGHTCFELEFRI